MKISIVINNFNYARFLPQCIESALNQSYLNKEVIVVDDGSTDGSREVIGRYGDRVKAVFKENGGQASALNLGFQHSSGGLIIFLDSDDYLYDMALGRIAAAWCPGLSKIHWRLQKIDDGGNKIGIIPKLKWPLANGEVAREQAEHGLICPPTSGNAFARKFLLQVMPIPEELFRICADEYLFARAPFFGDFFAVDEALGAYRIHGGNQYARTKTDSRNKCRRDLQRASCVNQLMVEDAQSCGIKVEPDAIYRNYGLLKARAVSLLIADGQHPVANDSIGKILTFAARGIIRGERPSRLHNAIHTIALLAAIIRTWAGRFSLLSFILCLLLGMTAGSSTRPVMLDVSRFGARGDAIMAMVGTVNNSAVIAMESGGQFSAADVGKVVLLFGAGPATAPANHQDLVATITQVSSAQSATLSVAAGATADHVCCTYGTQNAAAFQRCVDACRGTNTVVRVPAGRYLLLSPQVLDAKFVMKTAAEGHAAVTIRKGGIHFLGEGRNETILTGCGAWQLKTNHVYRGELFACRGPVTNDAPLIFENLTMDGGVANGSQDYHGFPPRTTDGAGWDMTHDAVVDSGRPPLHAFKAFRNCRFIHWRGEILKGVVAGTDGFIEVTNCDFADGNASAFNFSFSHNISGCTFSNLEMAMEFYGGYMRQPSTFENSTVTDVRGDLVLCGAMTNHVSPTYTIRGNKFEGKQFGVLLGAARNVVVISNRFIGQGFGIGTGAGYQGNGCNGNILVEQNVFTNVNTPFLIQSSGVNRMENVVVRENQATKGAAFAGGRGWGTNIFFMSNTVSGFTAGLRNEQLSGQWFLDDPSNQFPPHKIASGIGTSNTVTYADGRLQEIRAARDDAAFWLDDSRPEKIPTGAVLQIMRQGNHPATLHLSTTRPDAPTVIMSPADFRGDYVWTNQAWRPVATR